MKKAIFLPCIFVVVTFASAAVVSNSPPLSVIGAGSNNLLVSWPATAWNYALQYRSNLHQGNWSNVIGTTAVTNGQRRMLVTPPSQAGYFRLAPISGGFTNSIGMAMTPVPAGSFTMGYWQTTPLLSPVTAITNWVPQSGDYDETPSHRTTISQPFWLGTFEVSNKEYEKYDPSHSSLRGKYGFSTNDNEAVVFVSWDDANAFCNWLAAREGLPYRLPTEAEWEYACRAGTTTHYSSGDTLPSQYYPNNPGNNPWYPLAGNPVSLMRGQTPPNPWGFYDMHGNVEEWCYDWYGPYDPSSQTDPVGRADGISRVTRGGSHSTFTYYLRSENRSGAVPQDKSWFIGIRVALGNPSTTPPLPAPPPPAFQSNVLQTVPPGLTNSPDTNVPYFRGPWRFVNYPTNNVYGPVYSSHNHDPGGIVECANGDLLAVWFTCVDEYGREMAVAASRLRYGQTNWDNVSSFYDIPDRSDAASCLGSDGNQTLYYFCGVSTAATWGPLAVLMRTSTNNGATWTKPRMIIPDHNIGHQPITGFLILTNGEMILHCDATQQSSGGTYFWISHDSGLTWTNPAAGRPAPVFADGNTGAWIAGVHAAVAPITNGQFVAFGRGDDINDYVPRSVSIDGGTNWTYHATTLPAIGSPMRATILRLREGPLMLCSFASSGFLVNTASGGQRWIYGLYAAVSFDNGITWPYVRVVSDDAQVGHNVETMDGTLFSMSVDQGEPYGYLSSTQGRNGVVHLISSREYYEFNYKWLTTRQP